jgi:addiction module RelE/StbE family toxin
MVVRWTEPAARDLTRICNYIGGHSSAATARRVALSIYEGVASLSEFPEQGRPGRKSGTRELILSGLPYLAVYRLRGDALEVLRILHGAQNWP